jgi:predicted aspartyl protease
MHHAFTIRYDRRTRVLHTKVDVCLPVTSEEVKTQRVEFKEYIAIWDTGATHSAITKKVADELGLKPTGIVEVRYGNGKSSTNTYLVNISLPNKVMFGHVRVTEASLTPDDNISDGQHPQLLIGMDIISMGDFAVTNAREKTTLSFCVPSVSEIDFVPKAIENNALEGGNRHVRRAVQARQRKRRA